MAALIRLPTRPIKKYRNRPSLLVDGTIPRPLHGVNPRSIMGKEWWDTERKKAYAHNNYHCHCCGVYKMDAKIFQWLEGHETYDVSYTRLRMKYKGAVALCHCCHAVVHSGRTTQLYLKDKMTEQRFKMIVNHGQAIFRKSRLPIPVSFRFMELLYLGEYIEDATHIIRDEYPDSKPLDLSRWHLWRLEFNGKLYPPKHSTPEQWTDFYQHEDEDDD